MEEKLDGANAAISFDDTGALRLQSRGGYLLGGAREKHFSLFKSWAQAHAAAFRPRLGARYVVFGEWLFAKHTIFYDALPHFFIEFDVFDRERRVFLSTPERADLLNGLAIQPAPVLFAGPVPQEAELRRLVRRSLYKTETWRETLRVTAATDRLDFEQVARQTDPSDLSEGLYLKVETADAVVGRYKWVRAGFLQSVAAADGHWLDRPILPNRLRAGVEILSARHAAPGAYDA